MSLNKSFLGLGSRSTQAHDADIRRAIEITDVRLVKGPERAKGDVMFGRSDDKLKEKDRSREREVAAPVRPPIVEEKPFAPRERERPDSSSAPAAEVHAYFGKGSRISGKLNFEGTVRVDGKVEGEIYAKDTLIIGESADVTAEIRATHVTIRGLVRGDIHAASRLEILPPGRLYGNIVTPVLVIGEGVIFEGSCLMESQNKKDEKKVTPLGQPAKVERPNEATG